MIKLSPKTDGWEDWKFPSCAKHRLKVIFKCNQTSVVKNFKQLVT